MAKKIKILRRKLFEDDNQTTPNVPTENVQAAENITNNAANDNSSSDNKIIQYIGSKNPTVEEAYTNAIQDTFIEDIVKSSMLFTIKMSTNFVNDIVFPTAPAHMRSLLESTHMPKKFQNIYGSYDQDPLKTIEASEDLAEKYFKPFSTKDVSDNKEALEQANINAQNNVSTNESYIPNKLLNEIGSVLKGAAELGFNIGTAFSKGVATIGSGVSGLLVGSAAGKAIVDLAANIATANPDHGVYKYNDKELHKEYDETKTNSKSSLDAIHAAINNYVNNLLVVLELGLSHITSGNSKNEIEKFNETVIDALNIRSKEVVKKFIEDNNSRLKAKQSNELKKLKNKNKQQMNILKELASDLLQNALQYGLTAKDVAAFFAGKDNIIDKNKLQIIRQKQKAIARTYRNIDDLDDLDFENETLTYNFAHTLNEELEDDAQIVFDADTIYNEYLRIFRQHMTKILNSNPSEWDIIKTAKTQMEALRDGATEEIKKSIAQVCRMANGDQMGLSAKMTAFISKHPMREAKLTNLWKRHETDLNNRIEQRLKQISELDGKGPLRMAKEFYKNTIPNLLSMMLVYKTLFTMYNNEKLINPNISLGEQYSKENIENTLNDKKNQYPTLLSQTFSEHSAVLNEKGDVTYTIKDGFTNAQMDYLFLLINNLISPDNYNQALLSKSEELTKELITYANNNKVDEFFSRLTDFIIVECNVNGILEVTLCLYDAFKSINKDDMNVLVNIPATKVNHIADNPKNTVILGYIIKSQGEFIDKYINNKTLKIEADDESIKRAKNVFGLKDIEVTDNLSRYQEFLDKAASALSSIEDNKINENLLNYMHAYNEMLFYSLKNIQMNPFKIMATFIDMCNDSNLEILFNNTAIITSYEHIKELWSDKSANDSSWNAYIKLICPSEKEANELSAKSLGLSDKAAFELFNNKLVIDVEKLQPDVFNTDILSNDKYKSIPTPGGLKTWEDITKLIVTNESYNYIAQLMNINEFNKITFGTNAIKLLKSLLLYQVKVANLMYSKSRNDTGTFDELWGTLKIKVGDGSTDTLQNIIPILKDHLIQYDKLGINYGNKFKKLVTLTDSEFRTTLPSELTQVAGDFFNIIIYEANIDEIKDGESIVNMLKNKLVLNKKPIGDKDNGNALNVYIIALCDYIRNWEHNKLKRLCVLATNKPIKDTTEVFDNYQLYFGLRSYSFITEDEATPENKNSNFNSLEDFLKSDEGLVWLTKLTDSSNTQENIDSSVNTTGASVNNSIEQTIANDADILKNAAETAISELNQQ